MNTATELLGELYAAGARIQAVGDELKIAAPPGVLSHLNVAIRCHKTELLQLIEMESASQSLETRKIAAITDESTPESAPVLRLVPAVAAQLDSRTPEEWEAFAQKTAPTMLSLFLREVEKNKNRDGYISITPQLCAYWRCAEEETGKRLDLAGNERPFNPKLLLPDTIKSTEAA